MSLLAWLILQNFIVFLGAVATDLNPFAAAALGFLGMYIPGIVMKTTILAVWKKIRGNRYVTSALKGLECGAVGLVFTAVFRLWRIGFIKEGSEYGSHIDTEPWFALISVASFVASRWYQIKPPISIAAGGVLGMIWYLVAKQSV